MLFWEFTRDSAGLTFILTIYMMLWPHRDSTVEKELLSNLIHPNIIKLRGVAKSCSTFALILDCLVETLDQRIHSWRNNKPSKLTRISSLGRSISNILSRSKVQVRPGPDVEAKRNMLDHQLIICEYIYLIFLLCAKQREIYRCTNTLELETPNTSLHSSSDCSWIEIPPFTLHNASGPEGKPRLC